MSQIVIHITTTLKHLIYRIVKIFFNMKTVFIGLSCLWILYLILNRTRTREDKYASTGEIKEFVANVKTNMIPEMNTVELFSLAEIKHYGKYDSAKDAGSAKELYTRSQESTTEPKHIGKCHLSKGHLCYESKDAEGALEEYLKAVEYGYEEGIICIAKMYSFGIHPYVLPDKLFAAKLFSRYMHLTDTLSRWCKFYIQELNELSYADIDTLSYTNVIQSKTLPTNILERMDYAVDQMKQREIVPYSKSFDNAWMKTYDDDDEEDTVVSRHKILERIPKQLILNDSQNVHDHVLQSTAKEIIQALDTNAPSDPGGGFEDGVSKFDRDVREFKKQTGTKDDDVLETLDSLGTAIHSRYDKSEQDVFSMIWNRVKENSDMTRILEDNLASAIEDGLVVCSTGKIMRMLSTLDVLDEQTPDLKPTWAIRNELAQLVSTEIKNTLQSLDKRHNEAYHAIEPSEEQERMALQISEKIKANIIERSVEAYVKPKIVSESVLMFELDVFLNHI